MVNSGDARAHGGRDDRRVHGELSEDERRVLDLLAVGLPIVDVAMLLRMSEGLVRRHLAALLQHYGAEDRTSLVIAARRAGQRPGLARLARGVAATGPLPRL